MPMTIEQARAVIARNHGNLPQGIRTAVLGARWRDVDAMPDQADIHGTTTWLAYISVPGHDALRVQVSARVGGSVCVEGGGVVSGWCYPSA